MFLCFFFFSAKAFTDKVEYFTRNSVVKLKQFGFADNATFSFFVQGDNLDQVRMFLIHKNVLMDRLLRKNKFSMLCSQFPIHVSELNYSTHIEGNAFSWNGIVPKSGLYTPYILNCDGKESSYTIEMTYMNGFNCLDTREQFLPMAYKISTYIDVVFIIIFVITLFVRNEEISTIKFIFISSQFFKLLYDFIQFNVWRQKQFTDNFETPQFNSISIFLKISISSLILFAVQIIISGLGSYRTTLPFKKIATIIIQVVFIQSSDLLSFSPIPKEKYSYPSIVFSSIALVFYLRDFIVSLFAMIKVKEILYNMPTFIIAANRSIYYSVTTVCYLCLATIMHFLDVIISIQPAYLTKINEVCFIIQFVMQMQFFFNPMNAKELQDDVPSQEIPIFLDSPVGSELYLSASV